MAPLCRMPLRYSCAFRHRANTRWSSPFRLLNRAHAVAIQAITELRNTTPEDTAANQQYFTQLTDILRTYLHDRFGFNAMEMTTQEIIEQLRKSNDEQALRELKDLFANCRLGEILRDSLRQ